MKTFFIVFFISLPLLLQAEILSQGVGKVKNHFVTSREVKISYLIEKSFSAKPGPLVNLDKNTDALKREVSQILLEWMVYYEAQSFSVAKVSKTRQLSSERKLERYLNKSKRAKKEWQTLGVTKSEKIQAILRKLRAEDFIEFKTKSSLVTVSDSEALSYYKRNKNRFGNLPFARLKKNIKSYISQQQADRRLSEWFRVLQRKYGVRHYLMEKSL